MYSYGSYGTALIIICLSIILPRKLIIDAFDYSFKLTEDTLSEGSPCIMEDRSPGKCVELPKCPMRIKEVQQGKRFSISTGRCSFKNFIEIVCCPENVKPITAKPKIGNSRLYRPAEKACREYENITGEGGERVKPNIFGGMDAAAGEFPYMVALGYPTNDNDHSLVKYNCGGTLISAEHILSAAHCVNNINNLVPVEVSLGTVNLNNNAEYVQRIPVGEIISHPKYKRSMNYYDIAILKLRRSIHVSKNVLPICLQTKPIPNLQQLVNMSLIVTGWGARSFEDEGSERLQKTPSLQMIDRKKCSESYKGFSKLPKGLDDSMICVLDTNVTRRADACHGDSGGPLLLHYQSMNTVLGVTSFGQSCGSSIPAIYTSVFHYLDWIEETVWPNKIEYEYISFYA